MTSNAMINDLQTYYLAGHAAGCARRQGDEARCQFETSWFRRAQALEKLTDRANARTAFDNGYMAGRGEIKTATF